MTANVCERRIMAEEKVPIAEKIISLSDSDASFIVKGGWNTVVVTARNWHAVISTARRLLPKHGNCSRKGWIDSKALSDRFHDTSIKVEKFTSNNLENHTLCQFVEGFWRNPTAGTWSGMAQSFAARNEPTRLDHVIGVGETQRHGPRMILGRDPGDLGSGQARAEVNGAPPLGLRPGECPRGTQRRTLYLAWKYADDFEAGVIGKANVGGDNCYPGAVLGAILGAAAGTERMPSRFFNGLHAANAPRQLVDELLGTCKKSAP
jgi:hypothetical protein